MVTKGKPPNHFSQMRSPIWLGMWRETCSNSLKEEKKDNLMCLVTKQLCFTTKHSRIMLEECFYWFNYVVFCGYVVTMMKTHLILLLICREVAKGLMKYQPDIIISVHPLMQHVPLRILRAKGLLKKIVFTTVITDLSTCHPTWSVKYCCSC